MSEQPPQSTSPLPIMLGAFGVLVVVLVLVGVLFPLILERSPLGDVVYEAQINEAFTAMRDMEAALLAILEAAEVERFSDLFAEPDAMYAATLAETVELHSEIAVKLLSEEGRATLAFAEGVEAKLPAEYFEVQEGPWGFPYRFYLGPWAPERHEGLEEPPFLSYIDRGFEQSIDGIAPTGDEKVLIYSVGRDGVSSQPFAATFNTDNIAGDDVGSWTPRRAAE